MRLRARSRESVSPVIATILMVAITVVLAAVLYVLVSGFLNVSTSTKNIGVACTKLTGSANVQCNITAADAGVDFQKIAAQVLSGTGDVIGLWNDGSAPFIQFTGPAANMTCTTCNSPLSSTSKVVDDGNGLLGIGDVFYLNVLAGQTLNGATFKLTGEGSSGQTLTP